MATLKREIVDVLNHFRLSIQDVWGLLQFLLRIILPWIITFDKLYFSGCRIACHKYWSFFDFTVFTTQTLLLIRSSALTFVMWLTKLIFNVLRCTDNSNAWTRLTEVSDRVHIHNKFFIFTNADLAFSIRRLISWEWYQLSVNDRPRWVILCTLSKGGHC